MSFVASNQATCKNCGTTIWSTNRHDMKYCECGAISVDGGSAYTKRSGDLSSIKEESIVIDSDLAEILLMDAEKCEREGKNHWGAVLSALRVLRDNGYTEALDGMLKRDR